MAKEKFTPQGMKLWSLICEAGWDKYPIENGKLRIENEKSATAASDQPRAANLQWRRFESYLMKTFKVTHINALNEDEIRRAIATIKPYADKAKHDACKPMRSGIMAMVRTNGQDADWLHGMMKSWGYGDSLRALGYAGLVEVRRAVMECLGVESTRDFTAQRGKGSKGAQRQ